MRTRTVLTSSLAGMLALGCATAALAQTPPIPPPPPPMQPAAPPPPMQPAPPPAPQAAQQQRDSSATTFYPGTKSSATYQTANGTMTVNAGMPATTRQFGPPPAFKTLDRNNDGRLSRDEAAAYPPLDNSFLYVSGEKSSISRSQYERWVNEPK